MQKNVIIGNVFQPKDIVSIVNLFNQNIANQSKSFDKDEAMHDESQNVGKSIISTEYGTNPSVSP